MEISKTVVEKLAKARLAEAKRLQMRGTCDCGCGQEIKVTRFRPGHDAKLLSDYRDKILQIVGVTK